MRGAALPLESCQASYTAVPLTLTDLLWAMSVLPPFPQAFEVVTRPALDSAEAALDRVKMAIYSQFAKYGLPCPITGHSSSSDRAAAGAAAAAPASQ